MVAALYFSGIRTVALELTDAGQILYPSWRVAAGELPYVAFEHLYGPSLFFLNGALFWLGGLDLRVIRLALVATNALSAALAYALARRVARPPAALLATTVLVAIWGTPIWLTNTPYATYFATPLCLAGALVLLGEPRWWRPVAAGVCVGCATTFKQTQGVFAFLALACFLIADTPAAPGAPAWLSRAVRAVVLLAAVAVPVAYVRPHLAVPVVPILLVPFGLAVAGLVRREVAAWRRSGPAPGTSLAPLLLTAGMALPALGYALLYAAHGALAALVDNVLLKWPPRMQWFVPLRPPGLRPALLGAVVLASFAVAATWSEHGGSRGRVGIRRLAVSLAALAAALGALLLHAGSTPGLRAYLLRAQWTAETFALLPALPWCVLAVAWAGMRRSGPAAAPALPLLYLLAAGTLLQLFPCADLPHVIMILPAFVPLLAYALERVRLQAAGAAPAPRACAALLVVAWPLASVVPFVRSRLAAPAVAPTRRGFARAPGITGAAPRFDEAVDLVRHLSRTACPGCRLLVLTNEQLLYVLAGMPSALQHDEFLLYLVGSGLTTDADARQLADEEAMIRALATSRARVVDREDDPAATRFRHAFPRVARFLADACPPTATFGRYRLLACADARAP